VGQQAGVPQQGGGSQMLQQFNDRAPVWPDGSQNSTAWGVFSPKQMIGDMAGPTGSTGQSHTPYTPPPIDEPQIAEQRGLLAQERNQELLDQQRQQAIIDDPNGVEAQAARAEGLDVFNASPQSIRSRTIARQQGLRDEGAQQAEQIEQQAISGVRNRRMEVSPQANSAMARRFINPDGTPIRLPGDQVGGQAAVPEKQGLSDGTQARMDAMQTEEGGYAPGQQVGNSIAFETKSGGIGLRGINRKDAQGNALPDTDLSDPSTYGRKGPLAGRYAAQVARHAAAKQGIRGRQAINEGESAQDAITRHSGVASKLREKQGKESKLLRKARSFKKAGNQAGYQMAMSELRKTMGGEQDAGGKDDGWTPRDSSKASIADRAKGTTKWMGDLENNATATRLGINAESASSMSAEDYGDSIVSAMSKADTRLTEDDLMEFRQHMVDRAGSDNKFGGGHGNGAGGAITQAILKAKPGESLIDAIEVGKAAYAKRQEEAHIPGYKKPPVPGDAFTKRVEAARKFRKKWGF
jgi:hypothetical protein